MSLREIAKRQIKLSSAPGTGLTPVDGGIGKLIDVYIEDQLELTVSPRQLEDAIDFIIKDRRERRAALRADDGDAGGCVNVAFATRAAGGRQVSDYVMIDCVNLR